MGSTGKSVGATTYAICLTFGLLISACATLFVDLPEAHALPSYARQTGQQCAACHNGFPELTPYGRLFKLNGYTFGGGTSAYPPLSALIRGSFTNTQAGQPGGAAPHFGANNNFAFDEASLYYGGEIAPYLGTFAQMTYNGVGRVLSWNNIDIRYARAAQLFGAETIVGASVNNNPTVQDVWNTLPAWRFPYVSSDLAPSPAAATMIEQGFAQQVAGATAYAFWDRLVYLEGGGYGTLPSRTQSALGVNSADNNEIDGIAPYFRLALSHDWSRNSIEAGVVGMTASITPLRMHGFGANRLTDLGIDTQYQFLADRDSFSVEASAIFENQNLDASRALRLASNGHDTLRSYHAKATYFYDQTYGAALGVFDVEGTSDSLLYASPPDNSPNPNSAGITSEFDYFPFNYGGPNFWPWLNLKLGVQYIYYPKFNGVSGRAAADNNTISVFCLNAF